MGDAGDLHGPADRPGQRYEQPLTVKMDPRVKTPLPGLQQQFALSKQMYDGIAEVATMLAEIRAPGGTPSEATRQAEQQLSRLRRDMASIYDIIQDADVVPTTQVQEAAAKLVRS